MANHLGERGFPSIDSGRVVSLNQESWRWSPNRMLVNVSGNVANIERAFHVGMGFYQHPTEARTFYAPDREPAPDLPLALWHITGLDNFSIPQPASLMHADKADKGVGITTGSGPGGNFIGSDLRIAYYAPYGRGTLDGSGEAIGLLEFAGHNQVDVSNYFQQVNQPLSSTVTGISVDGSSLTCAAGCDNTEQVLDIEVAISMAPKSAVLVYVSDTSDVAIFNRMAADNKAKSLSCSGDGIRRIRPPMIRSSWNSRRKVRTCLWLPATTARFAMARKLFIPPTLRTSLLSEERFDHRFCRRSVEIGGRMVV